ncbi:MAG: basic amino acid ABC transporter substrate-binding protein [Dehalococcoidales bacterium]|mgnify:CR=1 FL=1|nr:basic amino acid ABC transporter substrate-binding protein [Dehalococcoidales bacterium]MDD3264415.1 basic amino acid ABC transporter substrate-binding protein [Dehalococcoidales bacterium]MDD4321956.1 basic amino acid ABC transporter substrate-binding protein [Dehalococcoidales bacterium]MDD4794041.1 basic amino acid ABC transporter substrate-binding protein [Dehalococcoidales bacterium]MDD5122527.1 basic amino acid ABC transporter substrate-binding protein [Dehalococcoidales bacterium]
MKRLLWLLLATVLVAGLLLPGCSGDSGKIRVATDATWPPFEYVDTTTGEIVGFDVDLFNAIAEEAGLEVEWINVEWDPLLAGVAQGTYDAAISSITIKEERKADMDFSDPYYIAGQIIVAKTDSAITGADDLVGKSVGVQSGTTGDDEVSAMNGVNVTGYDEIGMAFVALMNNQVDAVVCDTPVASGYVKKYDTLKTVGEVLTTEEYGIAMPKGSDELMGKINQALAEVKSKGIIDQLVEKWLVD